MYVALSRVTSINELYLTGSYCTAALKANKNASIEYERLKKVSLFTPLNHFEMALNKLTIFLQNTSSLLKHSKDLAINLNNFDILLLTETQLSPVSCYDSITSDLSKFQIDFNCSASRYNSLAVCYKNDINFNIYAKSVGFLYFL